ncbi:hypothetical protein BaOVIS_016730 [Babesia ovis]|uniref:Uncharacterized protein n=1 Tax=Babesia ovis TaxID=5869 RepID=A0A9W5WUW2_BABOV|nr:hypothetical protein BaOVIS_016730 [Babesia ovis]
MPKNKACANKSEETGALPQGVKKRVVNRQQEQSKNETANEPTTPDGKTESPSNVKGDKRTYAKAKILGRHKHETKREFKKDSQVEHATTPVCDSTLKSSPVLRHGSSSVKSTRNPVDSCAPHPKGSTDSQKNLPPRTSHGGERPRREYNKENEGDRDIVRLILKLHRIRFREFKRNLEMSTAKRDGTHQSISKEQHDGTYNYRFKGERADSATHMRSGSDTSPITRRPYHTNHKSHEHTKGTAAEKPVDEKVNHPEKVGYKTAADERSNVNGKPRRIDNGRPPFIDRKRRGLNERLPMDETNRSISHSKHRGRLHGQHVPKKNVKKEVENDANV